MSISARFRVARGAFVLDVDLTVPARGITGLFGPSGSGKTTLLRAIAGLDHHPGGDLRFGDATWQGGGTFVPTHKRELGYVFQEPSLFAHLTVRRNVTYGAARAADAGGRVTIERAIALLGIGHLLERKPDTLSGGERQRVAIARALAAGPSLMLMDEPLAALDRESRREILPYLETLHDELEIPVLYVSHTTEEVTRLADHLVLLDAGSVVAAGKIGDVLTRLDLPLAERPDAEVVVDAVVAGHDDADHLTELSFEGGRFLVTRKPLEIGARVRLRLAARDVSVTLARPSATSILNVFPATVVATAPAGEGRVTLQLQIGEATILSRVTRRSAQALALAPGKDVFAQVKSVAVLT